MKATIKPGAVIMQDHSFYKWEEDDTVFEAVPIDKRRNKFKLVAYGYGILGQGGSAYGNGPIFSLRKDIVFTDCNEYTIVDHIYLLS